MQIWSQAKSLAGQTPPERNRYVDFLRAISILVVIAGHWMIATAWFTGGAIEQGHLLKSHPDTQWLTWIFQVMPVFFIVGGYANAVSLESARRRDTEYAAWLYARLNRLVTPLLVLMFGWAGITLIMLAAGAREGLIQYASQAALIPTWFLAIYIMVAILAPATYAFWRRSGYLSFWVFAAIALAVDALFFVADIRWPAWSNYFWIWLAVHQLGYAWRDQRLGKPAALLACSIAGLTALAAMIHFGPYPQAMVGSPDEGLSNTLPPKVTLIVLGVFQFGLLLALESPARKMLENINLWAATVLVNSMIMTVYLWHLTVMIVVVALLTYVGGFGLTLEPGTSEWWLTRPIWVLCLLIVLVPVAVALSPFERRGRSSDGRIPGAARQVTGAMILCLGISLLAMYGYGGGPLPHLDIAAFLMVIGGSALSGLLVRPR